MRWSQDIGHSLGHLSLGWGGGSASKMVHSLLSAVGLITSPMSFCKGCLSVFTLQQLASPLASKSRGGQAGDTLPFMSQSWKSHSITSTLFCWSYWPETVQGVRGLCMGKSNRGPPWRLPTAGQSDFSLRVFSVFCCCYCVFPLGRYF